MTTSLRCMRAAAGSSRAPSSFCAGSNARSFTPASSMPAQAGVDLNEPQPSERTCAHARGMPASVSTQAQLAADVVEPDEGLRASPSWRAAAIAPKHRPQVVLLAVLEQRHAVARQPLGTASSQTHSSTSAASGAWSNRHRAAAATAAGAALIAEHRCGRATGTSNSPGNCAHGCRAPRDAPSTQAAALEQGSARPSLKSPATTSGAYRQAGVADDRAQAPQLALVFATHATQSRCTQMACSSRPGRPTLAAITTDRAARRPAG